MNTSTAASPTVSSNQFTTLLKQTFILFITLSLGLVLSGCDPYYPITLTNTTADTVSIQVKPTISFRTIKNKTSTTLDGFDIYNLNPKEQLQVGSAIAEIDNDIPFKSIKIIKGNDTISAFTLDDIKELFDKKTFGGLQTPYNLTIK